VATKDKKTYAAIFTPKLPRDDATLLSGIFELINTTYGKNTITDLQPALVDVDGKSYITFAAASGGTYYILPIKSDAGEVQAISYYLQ
jgi:hypothetical protein